MKTTMLKPGDLIEAQTHTGINSYSVVAVFLGALGQESVVELESLNQTSASDGPTPVHPLVPYHMLEAGIEVQIYRHTPKEQLGS